MSNLIVGSGQTSNGIVVSNGDFLTVASGGVANFTVLNSGGTELVNAGGVANATTVNSGGVAYVLSGGIANDTTVNSGGTETINSGGVARSTTVNSSGNANVLSGGTASATQVNQGGTETINPGGTASGSIVHDGVVIVSGTFIGGVLTGALADIVVGGGGVASGTTISAGALAYIASGGTTSGLVILGGQQRLDGGNSFGSILGLGGSLLVGSASTASATQVNSGGEMFVSAGGAAIGITLSGGKFEFVGDAVISGGVSFAAGTDGIFDFDGSVMPTVVLSGFDLGDTIVLDTVLHSNTDTVTTGIDTITLHAATGDFTLNVIGAQNLGPLIASDEGGGASVITVACFATGTRISTAAGSVAVQDLAVGTMVRSVFGGLVKVKWVGMRDTDCRNHPRPWDVWPVRVARGAFGPGRPFRDLNLSPDHSIYVDGVLVPVRYLLNGATIVQVETDRVAYWHVELPSHDVILAEGLPTESYLDTGNRHAFTNGGPTVMLHPDFAMRVWEAQACTQLIVTGPKLAAIRSWLLAEAKSNGYATSVQSDMHLCVDGQIIAPDVNGSAARFSVPHGARKVRLVTRAGIPAQLQPASNDHRRLGVAISAIRVDGVSISLEDPRLDAGWHRPETMWRWTNGAASLALPGMRELIVEQAMSSTYWLEPVAAYQVAI